MKKWKALLVAFLIVFGAVYLLLPHGGTRNSPGHHSKDRTELDSGNFISDHQSPIHYDSEPRLQDDIIHVVDEDKPRYSKVINVEKKQETGVRIRLPSKQPNYATTNINNFMAASNSSRQRMKSTSVLDDQDLGKVLDNIVKCMEATNLVRLAPLEVAERNTAHYVREYRKVVPTSNHFLSSCSNHCWETNYNIERQVDKVQGHIGNISFGGKMREFRAHSMDVLRKEFHNSFSSEMVCLPNIFLAGFPKCGSSFLWCFMNRLIRQSAAVQVEKEPHFWVDAAAYKYFREPTASDFSKYILNFAKGISQIEQEKCANSAVSLMDGSPNLMFNWPRFNTEDKDLANYCLIPSTLPHFLPSAKFIVIMRNPIKMLYSAFWFSCTMYGIKLSPDVQFKGPSLFHDRVSRKLSLFNDCMRDSRNPTITHVCSLNDSNYESCITKRLHKLDECVHGISFNIFGEDLPKCGRSRVAMGLYFTHIRKWLSVVPRDRFLFLTLEELVGDPVKAATGISRFLGRAQSAEDIRRGARHASLCNENGQNSVDYKTNSDLHMRNDTKNMLERFYRPFNALLAGLLQDSKFLWT